MSYFTNGMLYTRVTVSMMPCAHINALSQLYAGKDYTFTPGQVRVRYVIDPEHVDVHG
jgi:hypothetical protein